MLLQNPKEDATASQTYFQREYRLLNVAVEIDLERPKAKPGSIASKDSSYLEPVYSKSAPSCRLYQSTPILHSHWILWYWRWFHPRKGLRRHYKVCSCWPNELWGRDGWGLGQRGRVTEALYSIIGVVIVVRQSSRLNYVSWKERKIVETIKVPL